MAWLFLILNGHAYESSWPRSWVKNLLLFNLSWKRRAIKSDIYKRVLLVAWLMYTQLFPSFPPSPLPPLRALPVAPSFSHEVWQEGFIGSNRLVEHDSLIAHRNPVPPKLPRPPEEKMKLKRWWSHRYSVKNIIRIHWHWTKS